MIRGVRAVARLSVVMLATGCGDNAHPASGSVTLARAFRSEDLPGCAWASPVVTGGSDPLVVVATGQGVVSAYAPDGSVRWQTTVTAPTPGDRAWIAATPAVVDDELVIAWQDADASGARHAHHVGVLSAAIGAPDVAFPVATLAAAEPATGGGQVAFRDSNQFSRSTLISARRAGDTLGVVYVSFGNIQDVQPWHGWVFEVDLDGWRAGGAAAAVRSFAMTTPETSCGTAGMSGSEGMVCGGGVWTPSGPTLVPISDDYELWIPTGNGQLDLGRGDYANTILRTSRGLSLAPGCDATACASFDPLDPDRTCMESCTNVFMPRLRVGDPPLSPPNGLCDGKTFLQCYGRLDLDLGANAPVFVEAQGRRLGVLPAKDGAVYLFDADHFGTMFDRLPLRDFCGSHGGTCTANWAGTMVTHPAVAMVDGQPVIIVPTFYFDHTNPGGVVGLDIADGPTLRERWSAPRRSDAEAVDRFREHTGRAIVHDVGGVPYVLIADPGDENAASGILYAIDARTGDIAARGGMAGPGEKYIEPAMIGDRVFVTSCDTIMNGPTHLEAWDVAAAP
jgi:hypothetical protein